MPITPNNNQAQPIRKVFYWEGVCSVNSAKLKAYEKQIIALLTGNYKSAGLDTKKVPNHRLYTVRINDSDRLLCTTIIHQNKPYLLILEIIENHDYQKSKYLNNPSLLRRFLEKSNNNAAALQEINQFSFSEDAELVISSLPEEVKEEKEQSISNIAISYAPAIYYHDFIVLDDNQNQAIVSSLPVTISGPPGSGKSCVALSILKQQASKLIPEDKESILYITKSKMLAQHMQTLWKQSPEAYLEEYHFNAVEFKSYQEMITDNFPEEKFEFVDYSHFHQWIEMPHHKKSAGEIGLSSHQIYQELRICSQFNETQQADYLTVGRKNRLVSNENAMLKVFSIYQHYLQYLTETEKTNLDFFNPQLNLNYHSIVADEAQDFSLRQLELLYHAAQNHQVVYCIDTHQSLFDSKSVRPYLKALPDMKHSSLLASYRCSNKVIHLANRAITIKNNLAGGIADKDEFSHIKTANGPFADNGAIFWFQPKNKNTEKNAMYVMSNYRVTDIAVIASEVHLEEAKKLFASIPNARRPLLFTPAEIKGLEYELVILYRPLDSRNFIDANKKLSTLEVKDKKARAKQGEANYQFNTSFNQLFTSVTRAIDSCVILQDSTHQLKFILKELELVETVQNQLSSSNSSRPQEADSLAWINEANRQLSVGNITKAQEIFLDKLAMTLSGFHFFKNFNDDNNYLCQQVMTAQGRNDFNEMLNANPLLAKMINISELRLRKSANDHPVLAYLAIDPTDLKALEALLTLNPNLASQFRASDFFLSIPSINNFRYTVLHHFYQTEKGQSLFSNILNQNHNLVKEMLREELTRASIFSWLTAYQKHMLLENLLNTDAALIALIDAKDLYQRPPFTFVKTEKTAFEHLYDTQQGRQLLKLLFTVNPSMVAELPSQQFYCERALHNFTSDPEALQLFEIIFSKNPVLIQYLKVDHLFRLSIRIPTGGKDSLFFSLIETSQGRLILKGLIDREPNLIQSITDKDLCIPSSAISWLSSDEVGIYILEQLFANNPSLMSNISYFDLFVKQHKNSAFYQLLASSSGRTFLKKLFMANPSIVKGLDASLLEANVIFWLTTSNVGLELFENLLAHNPHFVTWLQNHKRHLLSDSNPDGHIALARLASQAIGRRLLSKYLLKPDTRLIKKISIKHLRSHINGATVFNWLSTDNAGLGHLKLILDTHPLITSSISLFDLGFSELNTYDDVSNTSFFNLSNTIEGRLLLKRLFINPAIGHKISIENLSTITGLSQDKKLKVTALFNLISDPEWHPMLEALSILQPNAWPKAFSSLFDQAMSFIVCNKSACDEMKQAVKQLNASLHELKTKTIQDFEAKKLNIKDAFLILSETINLTRHITKPQPLAAIQAFHSNTAKFQASWDWRTVLGAVIGAAIGLMVGLTLALWIGPLAGLTALYGASQGAVLGAALLGTSLGGLAGCKLGLWQTQTHDPLRKIEHAANKVEELNRPIKVIVV